MCKINNYVSVQPKNPSIFIVTDNNISSNSDNEVWLSPESHMVANLAGRWSGDDVLVNEIAANLCWTLIDQSFHLYFGVN